ncbi:carboxymuconolactone decarboxylase family protein [Rhodohalobacter sp. SW132]|uniref:carboxymuconolactone decarboxylase family protein n=1 Tax=Rhodohalobacter sp. SW132 TaxID=2293433 RepID=UPI000E25D395|nr:carboxymuconolactone decarboxylase family protein [Rhodohalobacter sp. SW132]REL38460.1 carboxymuconolactone decarboxylase family protein [Rhodohalobacter sp. SW132]
MRPFDVPTRDEVTEQNQQIFDDLKSKLDFVPNIYATYAHSDNALARYLTFANGKTSLNNKEKEVVNLAVSQVNGCTYCQAAHTAIGKMNGFSEDQTIELRKGEASFNEKFDALAGFAKSVAENRGRISDDVLQNFFDAGYSKENLVDVIVTIGDKTTTNLLHNVTEIPIDFPEAPELKETVS